MKSVLAVIFVGGCAVIRLPRMLETENHTKADHIRAAENIAAMLGGEFMYFEGAEDSK